MEAIIEKMQDETSGVPVRTVKSFMTKIPSVFTGMFISFTFNILIIYWQKILFLLFSGSDLILWMMKNLDVEDQGNLLFLVSIKVKDSRIWIF